MPKVSTPQLGFHTPTEPASPSFAPGPVAPACKGPWATVSTPRVPSTPIPNPAAHSPRSPATPQTTSPIVVEGGGLPSEHAVDNTDDVMGAPVRFDRGMSPFSSTPNVWDRQRSPFHARDLRRSNSGMLQQALSLTLKKSCSQEIADATKDLTLQPRKGSKNNVTISGASHPTGEGHREGPLARVLQRGDSNRSLQSGLARVLQRGDSNRSLQSGHAARVLRRGGSNISCKSHESKFSRISSQTPSAISTPMTTSEGTDPSVTASVSWKMRRTQSTLNDWWGLVPNNIRLVQFFSSTRDLDAPISGWEVFVMHVVLMLSQIPLIFFFSCFGCSTSMPTRGLQVHYWLLQGSDRQSLLLCALTISAMLLHILDWYNWPRCFFIPVGVSHMITLACALCFYVEAYPHSPLVVANLQVPLFLAVVRLCVVRCKASDFYATVSVAGALTALAVIVLWMFWAVMPDALDTDLAHNWWDQATEARLRESKWMPKIIDAYGCPSWQECLDGRLLAGAKLQPNEVSACQRVKLTVFLQWFSPVIASMWLMAISVICGVRFYLARLDPGGNRFDRVLMLSIGFILVCTMGLFSWASIAGGSLQASQILIGSVAAGLVCICIWLSCSFTVAESISTFSEKPWCLALQPLLISDYFTSFLLIVLGPLLLLFLGIEYLRRKVEVICRIDTDKPATLTSRAGKVIAAIEPWHWGSIIENAIYWCWFFLVIQVGGLQVSVVFFSWFNSQLVDSVSFAMVATIFYGTGLTMFLIPVVPGIPVYLSAGVVMVHAAQKEPWLGFTGGIVFTVVECLVLKLNAHVVEQKLFGECLGHSLRIQQFVGVHKVGIRAIKAILLEPGLRLKKVIILCGGPDWPTSVLTGILRLPAPQMLLGTLPVVFLIIPCVGCGALLLDKDLANITSIAMIGVAVCQGGAMLAALLIVLYDVSTKYDELTAWEPELDKILAYAQKAELEYDIYTLCTEWRSLQLSAKICLTGSLVLTVSASWASFLLSSQCFEDFDLSDDFYASLEDGGLAGNPLNLVKPFGGLVLSMVLLGIILFAMYYQIVSLTVKDMRQMASSLACPYGTSSDNTGTNRINTPVEEMSAEIHMSEQSL